jgi:hypothetical protein
LEKSAHYKLFQMMYREAAQEFNELLAGDPNNESLRSGFAMAYSGYDPRKAREYLSHLPKLSIPENMDIDALEAFNDFQS